MSYVLATFLAFWVTGLQDVPPKEAGPFRARPIASVSREASRTPGTIRDDVKENPRRTRRREKRVSWPQGTDGVVVAKSASEETELVDRRLGIVVERLYNRTPPATRRVCTAVFLRGAEVV